MDRTKIFRKYNLPIQNKTFTCDICGKEGKEEFLKIPFLTGGVKHLAKHLPDRKNFYFVEEDYPYDNFMIVCLSCLTTLEIMIGEIINTLEIEKKDLEVEFDEM